jgi:hypothetical protein
MVRRFSRRASDIPTCLGYHILSALAGLAGALGLAAPLAAQTYSLAPPPYQTVLNNSGAPVNNACVWTYAAGTTTPIATYSNNAGTPNTNPIRTDSAGRFTAYLIPGTGYKFVTELPCTPPAHGVVLRTSDNIAGTPSASVVTTGTWLPGLGGTATYTSREGTWVRVGSLVYARGSMTVNAVGTGSSYLILGLPFTTAVASQGFFGSITGAAFGVTWVTLDAQAGATFAAIQTITPPAGGTGTSLAGIFTNGTAANFTLVYTTNDP